MSKDEKVTISSQGQRHGIDHHLQCHDPQGQHTEVAPEGQTSAKGWRFWAIFPPLVIATLLMALESTVTATALPKITEELNAGENYVWFMNGYLLTA